MFIERITLGFLMEKTTSFIDTLSMSIQIDVRLFHVLGEQSAKTL